MLNIRIPEVKEETPKLFHDSDMQIKAWTARDDSRDVTFTVENAAYDPALHYWINLQGEAENVKAILTGTHMDVQNVTMETTTLAGREARKIEFDYAGGHFLAYVTVVDNKDIWAVVLDTSRVKEQEQVQQLIQEMLDNLSVEIQPQDPAKAAEQQQKIAANDPQVALGNLRLSEDSFLHWTYLCLDLQNTNPQRTIDRYRIRVYSYDKNGQIIPKSEKRSGKVYELYEYDKKIPPGQYADENSGWQVNPQAKGIGRYEIVLDSIIYTDGSEWRALEGQEIKTAIDL